jgi:hypothetical protein
MDDEQVFRMTLLCAWRAFIPVPMYYRIRSQSTGERLDRKQEGLFILIALRLCGLSTLPGVMAYLIRLSSMAWSSLPLPGGCGGRDWACWHWATSCWPGG